MREVLRTNDLVRLSFLEAVLVEADVHVLIMDQFTSAAEGSIGALPRRLMVPDDDYDRAREILLKLETEAIENPFADGLPEE